MDKAKAKLLAAELIERDFLPETTVNNGNYSITVKSNTGVTSANVQLVETALSVTASIKVVTFT
jgi:hypothetical protein